MTVRKIQSHLEKMYGTDRNSPASASLNWRWPCTWRCPGDWRDWSAWDKHPNLATTALFTDEEWKGAYILAKKPVPKKTASLRDVIRRIAMLGSFLAQKSQGEPGVKTLWLGFARIRDFVEGVEHIRSIYAL